MTECKKYSSGSYTENRGYTEKCINGSRVRFDIVKNGTAFHINRPSFKSGSSVINKMGYVSPLENVRLGVGNRSIVRNNFIAPPIRSREIIDFERLQAQDIEMGGIKVQFGDKTIEKLFKIQVDDKTDITWVNERNRRLAAGETEAEINNNPPFGREQRKVNKMTNFGEQNLSLEDKIEQIAVAVKQGNSETIDEMGKMASAIAALLGNIDTLSKMTIKDLNSIRTSIMRLNIPKNWQASFKDLGRVISPAVFLANKGPITMFLMSNIPKDRTLNEPIKSFDSRDGLYKNVALLRLFQMRANNRFFDLQDRTIETDASLMAKGLDVP